MSSLNLSFTFKLTALNSLDIIVLFRYCNERTVCSTLFRDDSQGPPSRILNGKRKGHRASQQQWKQDQFDRRLLDQPQPNPVSGSHCSLGEPGKDEIYQQRSGFQEG